MKSTDFVELVGRMRKYQKRFFKDRSPEDLKASKECEKKVDAIVERYEQSKQPKLFE